MLGAMAVKGYSSGHEIDLCCGDHVATNDLQPGVGTLDMLDHVQLHT